MYPGSPYPYYGLALAALKAKDYDKALQYLSDFVRRTPGGAAGPRPYILRGLAYMGKGDKISALKEISSVRKRYPGSPDVKAAVEYFLMSDPAEDPSVKIIRDIGEDGISALTNGQ
jgi:TolA-binding protein